MFLHQEHVGKPWVSCTESCAFPSIRTYSGKLSASLRRRLCGLHMYFHILVRPTHQEVQYFQSHVCGDVMWCAVTRQQNWENKFNIKWRGSSGSFFQMDNRKLQMCRSEANQMTIGTPSVTVGDMTLAGAAWAVTSTPGHQAPYHHPNVEKKHAKQHAKQHAKNINISLLAKKM